MQFSVHHFSPRRKIVSKTPNTILWRKLLFSAVWTVCFSLACLICPIPAFSAAPTQGLNGTYLQLNSSHSKWTPQDWEKLFSYFKKMNLSQLVVQWTVYDSENFLLNKDPSSLEPSVMETIMSMADAAGIKVFVGLVYSGDYWQKISQPAKVKRFFLDELYLLSKKTADDLNRKIAGHSSFYGWYITEEIDDVNWTGKESQQILEEYLNLLSEYLRSITPGKAVAISGFSNAAMSPLDLKVFWQEILKGSAIDTVFFQDGIGVKKLDLDNLPKYLDALKGACFKESRKLEVVVEVFSQTAGAPVNDGIFAAVPAPLARIKHQLMIARQYSSNVIAFSVPEYMTPLGGPQAEKLFNDYRKNIVSRKNSFQDF